MLTDETKMNNENNTEMNNDELNPTPEIGGAAQQTAKSSSDEPKLKVSDRRHWVKNATSDNADEKTAEPEEPEVKIKKPAYVEELEEKCRKSEEQLQQYIAAFKKNQQENDAFRQRMKSNIDNRVDQQVMKLLKDFIEIIDNIELSLRFEPKTDEGISILEGIGIIRQQFIDRLKALDVTQLSRINEIFDPEIDEVVQTVPPQNEEQQDSLIIQELRKGYLYKEKLLRSSQVVIVKKN